MALMPRKSPAPSPTRVLREQRQWETKYGWLREFVGRHGRLPRQSETMAEHDFKIGQWVDAQRSAYRRAKMPPDRARQLEAVPGWSWSSERAATTATVRLSFEDAHRLLVAWVEATGQLPTATTEVETPDGPFRLGAWCHRRKVDYRVGRLHPDHWVVLEQTPTWEWAQPRLSWLETYRLLCAWVAEHGHLPDPHVVVTLPVALAAPGSGPATDAQVVTDESGNPYEDGVGPDQVWLGNWVRLQRRARGRRRLNSTQVWLLERVPGWVWPDTDEAVRDLTQVAPPPVGGRGHLAVVPA